MVRKKNKSCRKLKKNLHGKSLPTISDRNHEDQLSDKSSCCFLNSYYQNFIDNHYKKRLSLLTESYQKQKEIIQGECFGDSDFYSVGLKRAGWNADDLIINCMPLQKAWARENGFTGDGLEIAVEMIRRVQPRVVYLQDIGTGTKDFLSAIRPYTELIAGQIASPVPRQSDISSFDIIFSSFPHFVERFRQQGITSYYQPLAFEPRILEKIEKSERIYPVTFVGGISSLHGKGKVIVERLAELIPMDFWGYGAGSLPEDSVIRKQHHGEIWGLEMFSILQQSKITINRHIDVAENYANNMRLFEATGCGALLITDYKDNLNELFDIGKEVVAYRSPEECAELIKYYLNNPDEAEDIARAGQERTLSDHTYIKRMEQTAEILERHLRYKKERDFYPVPDMAKISYGHTIIKPADVSDGMTKAWKSENIPEKQRSLVQSELQDMYHGKIPNVFETLAECLRPFVFPGCSVLEIGCSSGYYYEILQYLLNMRIFYTGVDYSEPLIKMAKNYYPKANFNTADGADLPFGDDQFTAVISSGILLHVPNYREHIKETVRVAERFVVAHRTPICRRMPTQHLKKYAYGVETVELVFNEDEIVSEFASNGLKFIKSDEYYTNPGQDRYEVTYIFEKKTSETTHIYATSSSQGKGCFRIQETSKDKMTDEEDVSELGRCKNDFAERSYSAHAESWENDLLSEERLQVHESWLREDTVDFWRHARLYEPVFSCLLHRRGLKWLTVGDGRYGLDAIRMKRRGFMNVLPTDIGGVLLEKAKTKGWIEDYRVENVECLSFSDDCFDYVLCKESYHHFPRPMLALYEMFRVARKGVVLIEPQDMLIDPPYVVGEPPPAYEEDGNYLYTLSRRELEKVALGLNLPAVAFKNINDVYAKGVEFLVANESDPEFLKFKRLVEEGERKCEQQKQKYNYLLAVIFLSEPSAEDINAFSRDRWTFKRLSRNPHI